MEQLVEICQAIRHGFLQTNCFIAGKPGLVYISDEQLLIKSIDSKAIASWSDFEYILSIIVENRILKVYVAHQTKLAQAKFDDLMMSLESTEEPAKKRKKRNRPKRAKKDAMSENGL